jgi:hypothetical protein
MSIEKGPDPHIVLLYSYLLTWKAASIPASPLGA